MKTVSNIANDILRGNPHGALRIDTEISFHHQTVDAASSRSETCSCPLQQLTLSPRTQVFEDRFSQAQKHYCGSSSSQGRKAAIIPDRLAKICSQLKDARLNTLNRALAPQCCEANQEPQQRPLSHESDASDHGKLAIVIAGKVEATHSAKHGILRSESMFLNTRIEQAVCLEHFFVQPDCLWCTDVAKPVVDDGRTWYVLW